MDLAKQQQFIPKVMEHLEELNEILYENNARIDSKIFINNFNAGGIEVSGYEILNKNGQIVQKFNSNDSRSIIK